MLRYVWSGLWFCPGFRGLWVDWVGLFLFRLDILVLLDYCGSPGAKWRVWRAVEFFVCLVFGFHSWTF